MHVPRRLPCGSVCVLFACSLPAAAQLPVISAGGVVNATGDRSAGVARGSLITIFGTGLSPVTAQLSPGEDNAYPVTYQGVAVLVRSTRAPLLYVSPTQINAQIPYEEFTGPQSIQVITPAGESNRIVTQIALAAPAIFSGGVVKNSDFSVVTPANPARPGDVLVVYATGLGTVTPPVRSGVLAPSQPISRTANTFRVAMGDASVVPHYSILAPGYVGLYQVAFTVPLSVRDGRVQLSIPNGNSVEVATSVAPASTSMFPDQHYPVGFNLQTFDAIVTDMDRDGLADLAAAGFGGFAVIRGIAPGQFGPPKATGYSGPNVGLRVGSGLRQVVWADFNQDGTTDALTTHWPPEEDVVSLWYGSPDGAFRFSRAERMNGAVVKVYAANLNGDAFPDRLVVTDLSGRVQVITGLASAAGSFAVAASVPARNANSQFEVADANGDGLSDLIGYHYLQNQSQIEIDVWNADGAGGWSTAIPSVIPGRAPSPFDRIISADVDRDGVPDIVISSRTTLALWVLKGAADGKFQLHSTVRDQRFVARFDQLRVADINGDGAADLLGNSPQIGGLYLMVGNGLGSFGTPAWLQVALGEKILTIPIADTTGDGLPEILIPSLDKIAVLINRGSGVFERNQAVDQIRPYTAADLNKDGVPDLIASVSGGLVVHTARGDGTFERSTPIRAGMLSGTQLPAVGDLNGDASPDLLLNEASGREIVIMLGRGGPAFEPSKSLSMPRDIRTPVLADLNRDGRSDLIASDGSRPFVYLGNGDGTFDGGAPLSDVTADIPSVSVADVNGDGHQDILYLSDRMRICYGRSDGTFSRSAEYRSEPFSMSVVVDFNKDGIPDVLGAGGKLGLIAVTGGRDGTIQRQQYLDTAVTIDVAAADINQDGRIDAVTVNQDSRDVSVHMGDGAGGFAFPLRFGLGPVWAGGPPQTRLLVADFNADGKPDILAVGNLLIQR